METLVVLQSVEFFFEPAPGLLADQYGFHSAWSWARIATNTAGFGVATKKTKPFEGTSFVSDLTERLALSAIGQEARIAKAERL